MRKRDRSRKSVSVSSQTYDKLKAFCDANGVSMAQIVEEKVNEYLDAQPENLLEPMPEVAGGQP